MADVNNTICKPAQEHLFISSQGYLAPCCFIKDASTRLQDVQDPVTWFYQNDTQYHLRQNLNNNVKDARCSVCWKNEAQGKWSLRTNENGDDYQGSQPSLRLLHIVGGRLCNLACKMCYADLSSMVQKEQRPWERSYPNEKDYNWIDQQANINKLIALANTDTLEELQLQGGEPQLIKGFLDVLESIPYERKQLMQIQVTTNGTVFNERFWQQVKDFRYLIVGLSIDATAERYNLIRYHGDWTVTEKNTKKLFRYLADQREFGFSLNMNIVQQLSNLDQSTRLAEFLESLNRSYSKLSTYHTLMPVGDNACWDLHNVPTEILVACRDQMQGKYALEREWQTNVDKAIKQNNFTSQHAQEVVDREQWFQATHGKCVWHERPDWKIIYEKNC